MSYKEVEDADRHAADAFNFCCKFRRLLARSDGCITCQYCATLVWQKTLSGGQISKHGTAS